MTHPHLILSPGTRVVALVEVRGADGRPVHPRGAVGVVIQSPADYWHSYRVRFPDHFEAVFKCQEFAVLADFKSGGVIGAATGSAPDPLAEYDLYHHVIYRCIVGSRVWAGRL